MHLQNLLSVVIVIKNRSHCSTSYIRRGRVELKLWKWSKEIILHAASTIEQRRERVRHNLNFIICAAGADGIRCGFCIATRRLDTFRIVSDEGRTDVVHSFRLQSPTKAPIHRIPRSVITYEQLHSIKGNWFHCRFRWLCRSELDLRKVVRRFSAKEELGLCKIKWYIVSSFLSYFSVAEKKAWRRNQLLASSHCKDILRSPLGAIYRSLR